jgi:hypothetical protein
MTLSLDKTWVVSKYSVDSGVVITNTNSLLVGIKDLFKAHGWAVASSSDGATADEYDHWVDNGDIVNATGNHSWIVLTNSNISTNFAFCIDCNVTTTGHQYHNFYCCTSGYNTNGTISTRPTIVSGYEVTLLASTSIWHTASTTTVSKAMLFSSSDNKSYRLFLSGSTGGSIWVFDVPKDPVTWWTIPYVASVAIHSVTSPSYASYCSTTPTAIIKSDLDSATISFGLASIGNTGGAYGAVNIGSKQDLNGEFIISPTYLVSNTTTRPGIYGTLYDLYWTSIGFESCIPKSAGFLATDGYDYGLIIFGSLLQGNDGYSHQIGN